MKRARLQSAILNSLRTAGGGLLSTHELIAVAYPDPDMEPDYAENNIASAIMHLRRRGFPIRNIWGRGYFFEATK